MKKQLLLGAEAIALAAIDAGISGVYAYPGTPSTEITEYIQRSKVAKLNGVRSRWAVNEKTAYEAALGMSYAGKRSLVCMKHVGLNVAADAFMCSASPEFMEDWWWSLPTTRRCTRRKTSRIPAHMDALPMFRFLSLRTSRKPTMRVRYAFRSV